MSLPDREAYRDNALLAPANELWFSRAKPPKLGRRCHFWVFLLEHRPESPPCLDQPSRDRALGAVERDGNLAVGVAVVVAQDEQGSVGRLQLRHRRDEGARGLRWISVMVRPSQAADDLPHLPELLATSMRDRGVDGDPHHPGLGGGIGAPATPGGVGAHKGLLGAILGGGSVAAENSNQGADNLPVAVAVKAIEVGVRPGLVVLHRRRHCAGLNTPPAPVSPGCCGSVIDGRALRQRARSRLVKRGTPLFSGGS